MFGFYKLNSNLGLINFSNQIVLPLQFDNYIRETNNEYIDFIEYPIFGRVVSKNLLNEPFVDYNNFQSKDHIIHRYSLADYSLLKRFKVKGKENNNENDYLFLSDFDYIYINFYEKIKKVNFSKTNFSNISPPLTVMEFDELKLNFNNEYKISNLLEKYLRKRKVLQIQKEIDAKKSEGCYIATMVYKSYDHPEVLFLRQFRDQHLQLYFLGRVFIREYYKYSPKYVDIVKNKKLLNFLSKVIIFIIVKVVKKYYNRDVKKLKFKNPTARIYQSHDR